MRNRQLVIRLWCVATVLLGIVVIACDGALSGNLNDALAGQPSSLGDDGTPFSIILLVVGALLVAGGVVSLLLASTRRRSAESSSGQQRH